jgi:hypothetical protein
LVILGLQRQSSNFRIDVEKTKVFCRSLERLDKK